MHMSPRNVSPAVSLILKCTICPVNNEDKKRDQSPSALFEVEAETLHSSMLHFFDALVPLFAFMFSPVSAGVYFARELAVGAAKARVATRFGAACLV